MNLIYSILQNYRNFNGNAYSQMYLEFLVSTAFKKLNIPIWIHYSHLDALKYIYKINKNFKNNVQEINKV